MAPSIAMHHKHLSFALTKLNEKTVLFQTIQFSIIHLVALSLNIK